MNHYLIALGSNRRHARHGLPRRVITAAFNELGLMIIAKSRIIESKPIGPSQRNYANAAALIETELSPEKMLSQLKRIEAGFGRRTGRRWASRVLDLDIILWSHGFWSSPALTIPHPAFRQRGFVLTPIASVAPQWRDPVTNLTVRQLKARLDRKHPRN